MDYDLRLTNQRSRNDNKTDFRRERKRKTHSEIGFRVVNAHHTGSNITVTDRRKKVRPHSGHVYGQ